MLRNTSRMNGYAIAASDGTIGMIDDFLFDDITWSIRWVVVDTGIWLSGRKVLLPPSVLGHPNDDARQFPVRLTMQQIKDSPDIDTQRPVSRQMETDVYGYYGWTPYWSSGFYMGAALMGSPMPAAPPQSSFEDAEGSAIPEHNDDDPHLRSAKAVTGYHIHASDGAIGHIEELLTEEEDWTIRYLVVDTKNWWPGKKVLILPNLVRKIDWLSQQASLAVDRQTIKDSPEYDPTMTIGRPYEHSLLAHYGIGGTPYRTTVPPMF